MSNGNHNGRQKTALERIGCEVSSWVSDVAADPLAQIGVILVCGLWFALGLATEVLTAILSILAITLTQMVLNRQKDREADAHRRDVAMHAKIDELVLAMKGARNEMAGIEELDEEDIEELKEEAKEAIDEAAAAGDVHRRAAAKRAIDSLATAKQRSKQTADERERSKDDRERSKRVTRG